MPDQSDQTTWYTVKTVTIGKEQPANPAPFATLAKAEAFAKSVRTNPDVLSAIVLRSAPPKFRILGHGTIRPNMTDQDSFERYGHAYVVYAPTQGDHHKVVDILPGLSYNTIPMRTDAQKSAWAKSHPQCFPFHRTTLGVN